MILWSACQLVAKYLGPKPSIRQHIAHLHHLRFIETPVIEISVSADYACDHCHKFKDLISALTGIKFVIKLPPTLTEIPRVRNEQGKRLHPVVEVESPKYVRYQQEPVHLPQAPIERVEPQRNLRPIGRPETPKLTKSREKAVNLLAEVAKGQLDLKRFSYVDSVTHSIAKKGKYHDTQDADTDSESRGPINRHRRSESRPTRESSNSRGEFRSMESSRRYIAPDLLERARRPYRRN